MANPSQGQASDQRESEPLLESNGSGSIRNDDRAMESEAFPSKHLRASRLAFIIAPALLFGYEFAWSKGVLRWINVLYSCFNTAFDLSFLMTNYIRIGKSKLNNFSRVWLTHFYSSIGLEQPQRCRMDYIDRVHQLCYIPATGEYPPYQKIEKYVSFRSYD